MNNRKDEEMLKPRLVPNMMKKNSRGRALADSMICRGDGYGGGTDPEPSCQQMQKLEQVPPQPPKTLTRLIARRNWWEIERLLSSNTADSIDIEIDEKKIITEESVLHFALRYRAPLHIIKLLAQVYPLCLTRPDCTGKYAIHVACKYGSLPNVVEYLVSRNKHAAGVQDPVGKTAIHYVAEFYASNYETVSQIVNDNMLVVIRMLREAAPESFNLEDDEERNAIEYAIENDYDIKIIKMMQRAARDDWRALKASGLGKKHEDLAREVGRSASEARLNVVLSDVRAARASTAQSNSFVAKTA